MHKTFHFLKLSGKKAIVAFISVIIVITAVTATTFSYLADTTRTIPNTFRPAEIEISSWSMNDLINAGTTEIYVRAAVVSAWVSNDDKKTVWSTTPQENVDYTLTIDNGWFKASDGFYYRKEKINAAQSVSFVSATQNTTKDGYTLRILVTYSAIQTNPTDVVESSWGAVEVSDNGALVPKQ
jgi:hypothetical protein